ncbi:phosphatase PAP2 family protein [Rhizobium sp. GN54]|uniref:phosphatase PAP2 family protein n=1 Tax=Rhizobium sp. GN54 TaxID=2898150 RepID=UPI001E49FB34|nr:phosphatase PAP2 family protein [Rhizobium sp. GN54]MCD2182597.1 phosphatase PAP2 family protein [Rhizobium sp. GN54]
MTGSRGAMIDRTRQKQSFRTAFKRRYAVRRKLHRRVPWKGFALSALNVVAIAFFVFDRPLGQAAEALSPPLVAIAGDLTDIGKLAFILGAIAMLVAVVSLVGGQLFRVRRRFRLTYLTQMAAYTALSVVSASIVVHALKFSIGRARPPLYNEEGIFSFQPFGGWMHESFPSGHSAHIGALFMALVLLFPRLRLFFIGLGLWLAATRVIIGVHYPSDVAAGLALGCWFAFATSIVFARFGLVFTIDGQGWPTPRLSRLI